MRFDVYKSYETHTVQEGISSTTGCNSLNAAQQSASLVTAFLRVWIRDCLWLMLWCFVMCLCLSIFKDIAKNIIWNALS